MRRAVLRERVDDLTAGGDLGLGGRGQLHGGAAAGDRDDFGEANRPGADDDVFMLTMVGHRLARPAPPRQGRPDEGYASPLFIAISRSSTSPPLTRSPSCSHSFVTQARRPRIPAAVRSDSGAGTYMSSK